MSTITTTRRRALLVAAIGAVVVAVVVIIAATGAPGTPAAAEGAQDDGNVTASGPVAPNTPFEFFDGSPATLASYRGEPLVVNFWASWCPSCVAELSAAFRPVQDRLGSDVAFLGMNIQDDRSRALALVDETGIRFDLAEDRNGDLYADLGGLGMPFTVLISPEGEVVHTHNGPVTESQLADLITEHLLS